MTRHSVPSLRIGFDGRAFSSPAAGVRRYVTNLVSALQALDEALELVALGGRDPGAIPDRMAHVPEPLHLPTNAGWMITGLPAAARRAAVDLVHAPAYTAPLWASVPIVLTIHDVSYARRPEWYPYRSGMARQWFYRRSAGSAAHILTDSEFSASEIAAVYAIPRSAITVAPLGVDSRFTAGESGAQPDVPRAAAVPYLLHVGDLHPRRNLEVLVRAVAGARRHSEASSLSLFLAGIDRGVGGELLALASASGVADAVHLLGSVGEDQLRRLYRGALALCYPSKYEGFGLPLLEAMASGTPVIASRAASIPEVVGEAAMLVEPDDVGAWTAAIVRVADDVALRHRMADQGIARAATFTWDRTARMTLDVYRQVMSRR